MTSDDDVERWSWLRAKVYARFSGNPRSNRVLVEAAAPGPGDVVVDIGCGAGAAVRHAAATGAEAIGIDPSPAMVDSARKRSRGLERVRFEVGDAAALPLDDASATIAMATATYHHWPDGARGLAEVSRVLVPGGRVLIAERRVRRAEAHGLTAAEIAEVTTTLRALGFSDVTVAAHRLRLVRMQVISATAPGPRSSPTEP